MTKKSPASVRPVSSNATIASNDNNHHDDDPSPGGGAMPVPSIKTATNDNASSLTVLHAANDVLREGLDGGAPEPAPPPSPSVVEPAEGRLVGPISDNAEARLEEALTALASKHSDLTRCIVAWDGKQAWEELHPETRWGKAPKGGERKDCSVQSFGTVAASRIGKDATTIWRWVDLVEKLFRLLGQAEVRRLAEIGTRLANNPKGILAKIAKLRSGDFARDVVGIYQNGAGEKRALEELSRWLEVEREQVQDDAPPDDTDEDDEPSNDRSNGAVEVHAVPAAGSTLTFGRSRLLFGDALTRLRDLPDESIHCVVCSPPFFHQRDFGTRSWFGGNPKCLHNRHVPHRAHHPGQVEQTIWKHARASGEGQSAITYSCSSCGAWYGQIGLERTLEEFIRHLVAIFREVRRVLRKDGLLWVEMDDTYVNKRLLIVPSTLAKALVDDGWILRCDPVWEKRTAMPQSAKDRPTRSHSYIFQFSKSERYYYDAVAVMEPTTGNSRPRTTSGRKTHDVWNRANESFWSSTPGVVTKRNLRSVWSFGGGRNRSNHTATFTYAIPRICILASTSAKGACPKCGAPWKRIVDRQPGLSCRNAPSVGEELPPPKTLGWQPTCGCQRHDVVPCEVLDIFAGSGTTLVVAWELGRDWTGIELNEKDYARPILEALGVLPALPKVLLLPP